MKRSFSSETYADALAFLHFAWTIVFWGGAVAVAFYHPYAKVQAVALVLAFVFNAPFKITCLLTTIEEKLRKVNNPDYSNGGSFLAYYINKFFGTRFSRREADVALVVGYVCSCTLTIFALIYP